jgi:hypothetical protein
LVMRTEVIWTRPVPPVPPVPPVGFSSTDYLHVYLFLLGPKSLDQSLRLRRHLTQTQQPIRY